MINFLFTLCLTFFSFLVLSQYCTSVGPASTADSNVEFVSISGSSGTSITYYGCPGVVGLEDLTATEIVNLDEGSPYTLFVQFGTCGGNYSGSGEAWIDFNANGIFESSESVGNWTGLPPTAMSTFNFNVPGSVTPGMTRMRIMQHEGVSLPLNPCASFTWGSVVDFSVQLTSSVDCSSYYGDYFDDNRPVSAIPYSENHSTLVCYSNQDPVYNSPDVFYEIYPTTYGVDYLDISLCGSTFDTYLSVVKIGLDSTFIDTAWVTSVDTTVIAYNDDFSGCSPQSQLSIDGSLYDTLYVIVQGWGSQSGDYTITINESTSSGTYKESYPDLKIFPNPTIDYVFINGIPNNSTVSLYDATGRLTLSTFLDTDGKFDVSYLEPGIYYLSINNNLTSYKLVIQ